MDPRSQTPHTPYSVIVAGSGPALLLVPGMGGRANFAPVMEALAAEHTVIAPEYPGIGGTPTAEEPLSIDGMAESLAATATGAGVERFTLVGFSMGTLVATRLAARFPERVDGVVLTSALARPDNRVQLFIDIVQSLVRRGDVEGMARFTALCGFGPDIINGLGVAELGGFLKQLEAGVDPCALEITEVVRTADVTADLARIAKPTLVVDALRDVLVTTAHTRELAAGIAGAEYAEIDAGHVVLAERPAEWLETVSRFLTERKL
ncbi:alpha/beta fold hydrolase [Streptomyces sp. MP131-18]|uniref:alpha/beta fold hydrolase n=1 Tax=Streptomyces sp. MP131-18 TaxID=1857892 RepID=UPI00097C0EA4|nr:alpha/beta fold hydrolase [Streptomyces sp. MP131-18]